MFFRIVLIVAISTMFVSSVVPESVIARNGEERELKVLWVKEIPNAYKLSILNTGNAVDFVILNQGERKIEVLDNKGEIRDSWKIKVRGWPQGISCSEDKIFLASASPNSGSLFSKNGELKNTFKLFKTGAFTLVDGGLLISTFADSLMDNSTIALSSNSLEGKEIKFQNVFSIIEEKHRTFLLELLRPILIGDKIILMDKHYPLIIAMNRDGSLVFSKILNDKRFEKATKNNLLNGGGKYQFTSIDRLENDLLVSHVAKPGRIELIRISIEGEILNTYSLKELKGNKSALCSIVVVKANPLEVAILDSRTDLLRYCTVAE